jgi:hypothetical protein
MMSIRQRSNFNLSVSSERDESVTRLGFNGRGTYARRRLVTGFFTESAGYSEVFSQKNPVSELMSIGDAS